MHTKGEHHVKTGVILPQVGELPETRKEDLEQILLSGLKKEMPCGHLNLRTVGFQTFEIINLLFKPLGFWYFVTRALGNECS